MGRVPRSWGFLRDLICVTETVTQQTQHTACLQRSCRVTSHGLRLFEVGLEDPGCTIGQRPEGAQRQLILISEIVSFSIKHE